MEKLPIQELWSEEEGINYRIDELGRCVINWENRNFIFGIRSPKKIPEIYSRENVRIPDEVYAKMVRVATRALDPERFKNDKTLIPDAEEHQNNMLKDVVDP